MNKLFMGLLAVAALALIVSQAIARASNANNNAANAHNGGVMIIETYSASSVATPGNADGNNDMQPLPGDPGVEVAPLNSSVAQPIMVEEDVMIQQTEDGE